MEDLKEEIKEFYEFFDYSWMKNIEEPWLSHSNSYLVINYLSTTIPELSNEYIQSSCKKILSRSPGYYIHIWTLGVISS